MWSLQSTWDLGLLTFPEVNTNEEAAFCHCWHCPNLTMFKTKLKNYLFSAACNWIFVPALVLWYMIYISNLCLIYCIMHFVRRFGLPLSMKCASLPFIIVIFNTPHRYWHHTLVLTCVTHTECEGGLGADFIVPVILLALSLILSSSLHPLLTCIFVPSWAVWH